MERRMNEIAAVILALNEQKQIKECIASVRWTHRVVVFDTYSADETVPQALSAGAEVMQHRFENYAQIRNAALEAVQSDWVFFIDADERATPALAAEIREVTASRPENGWWVPRHNYLFGKLTLSAGWYPDYQMRLIRRGKGVYDRPVHEVVILTGDAGHLQNPLLHYNYETVAEFHAKQARYSDYDAERLHSEGLRPRPYSPATQFLHHFYWRFISLHGYRDRTHGLRLCLLTAWYEAITYQKLRRLWAD